VTIASNVSRLYGEPYFKVFWQLTGLFFAVTDNYGRIVKLVALVIRLFKSNLKVITKNCCD
jgi:hypothetical protein